MGSLTCGDTTVWLDDRLLTHLQIWIIQRFRVGRSFAMSWFEPGADRTTRRSIRLTRVVPVLFVMPASPAIDPIWPQRSQASADGPRGLIVTTADGAIEIADS